MSIEFRTCRLCRTGKPTHHILKYRVRHYACPSCFLKRYDATDLGALPSHEIAKCPVDLLPDRHVVVLYERARRREGLEPW